MGTKSLIETSGSARFAGKRPEDFIDFRSDTWAALRERATRRLALMRQKNDGALNAETTAAVRGRIAELKEFLALEFSAPEDVADEQ